MNRINWPAVLSIARGLVHAETAEVGVPPSLRRLHYLLVSDAAAVDAGYRNTTSAYKGLSARTAPLRDAGTFPALLDQTRGIDWPTAWASETDALAWLGRQFRLDRCGPAGLDRAVIVAEKRGILPLIRSRFWWMATTSTNGYASQTHAADLGRDFDTVIYCGDYDPTGTDIDRDLAAKTGCDITRVLLNRDQVDAYGLPPMPAKPTDSRTKGMDDAMQVELDAMPPAVLLDTVRQAIGDVSTVPIRANGTPELPDLDAEEAEIRGRLTSAP